MIYKYWHQAGDRWSPSPSLVNDKPPPEIVEIAKALDNLEARAIALGVVVLVHGEGPLDTINCTFQKVDPVLGILALSSLRLAVCA